MHIFVGLSSEQVTFRGLSAVFRGDAGLHAKRGVQSFGTPHLFRFGLLEPPGSDFRGRALRIRRPVSARDAVTHSQNRAKAQNPRPEATDQRITHRPSRRAALTRRRHERNSSPDKVGGAGDQDGGDIGRPADICGQPLLRTDHGDLYEYCAVLVG